MIKHIDKAEIMMLKGNKKEAAQEAAKSIQQENYTDRALMIIGSCNMHDPHKAIKAFSMVEGELKPFAKFNTAVAKAILDLPDAIENLLECMPTKYTELKKGNIKYKLSPSMVHLAAANLLQKKFMDKESIPHLEKCLERGNELMRSGLNPDVAKLDLAYARMREGIFNQKSWQLHESRWLRVLKMKDPPTKFKNPKGKTVLIYMEQGFGDNIQFIRFTKLLKEMGATTIIKSRKELTKIIGRIDSVDLAIDENLPDPPHDLYLHTMSLPYLLEIGENIDKCSEPYINPNPQLVDEWSKKLPKGKKIGIAWKGSPRTGELQRIEERNLPMERLVEIIPEDFEILSLQKGDHERHPKVHNVIKEEHDYDDTAAIISHLELVLCVDTSVAHLAGSMGKKTLMLSRKGGCWRWGKEGNSPWYPNMKIFRQKNKGDWREELEEIRQMLHT